MQKDSVSVTLAVGGASWQKTLAASLMSAGMLRRVFRSGRYVEILDPKEDGTLEQIKRFPLNRVLNRVLWGVWGRLPRRWRGVSPVMVTVLMKDRAWSRWMPRCSVFHGWMGESLASVQAAKRLGAATLVENPGRHPGDFHKAPLQECERFHIKPSERSPLLPAALIRRMLREYEICDRIVVPSNVALRSFAKYGLGNKAAVVSPGVDDALFSPRQQDEERRLFRACFAGRVELAKGAGDLLLAWKRLRLPNAELVLAGEVRPEMKGLLEAYADSSVRVTGRLAVNDLLACYRESDVFVLPSVNEGFAQVLLEAMATGLAVVASEMSGAEDCVTQRKEGFIVPARDADRLAEAMLWCYQHRDEVRAMGKAARARIESEFTLNHYNQRMISLYGQVAEARGRCSR